MPFDQFWYQFWYALSKILPWFVAGGGTIGLLLLTPFGKALTRALRAANRSPEAPPELLEELSLLRSEVGEVLGRLDGLEGYLRRSQDLLPRAPDGSRLTGLPLPSPGVTPH